MPLANIKLWRTAAIALAACLLVPLPHTTAAAAGDGKIMVQWFGQSAPQDQQRHGQGDHG